LCSAGHFIYHLVGNKRGEITEKEIDLNRVELIEMRKERIDAIRTLADKYNNETNQTLKNILLNELQKELADNKPYSMCARSVFQQINN